jgi:hypothetical protein
MRFFQMGQHQQQATNYFDTHNITFAGMDFGGVSPTYTLPL